MSEFKWPTDNPVQEHGMQEPSEEPPVTVEIPPAPELTTHEMTVPEELRSGTELVELQNMKAVRDRAADERLTEIAEAVIAAAVEVAEGKELPSLPCAPSTAREVTNEMTTQIAAAMAPKRRGRPPGSKNKPKRGRPPKKAKRGRPRKVKVKPGRRADPELMKSLKGAYMGLLNGAGARLKAKARKVWANEGPRAAIRFLQQQR